MTGDQERGYNRFPETACDSQLVKGSTMFFPRFHIRLGVIDCLSLPLAGSYTFSLYSGT
jgi:hypothetical protein